MEQHRILTIALSALLALPAMAQDRNNEDEVPKVDARFSAYNYREGEVIVKFKDQSPARINAPRRTVFKTSGINDIDATLKELGVTEVEELMPLSGNLQVRKLARSVNGKTIEAPAMNRIYLLHYDKSNVRDTEEAIAKLEKLSDVEYAEPNRIVYALGDAKSLSTEGIAPDENSDQTGGGE